MEIVVDTSVLVGLLVPNDHWHKQAKDLWRAIRTSLHSPVHFDCVAAEVVSVIVRRMEERGFQDQIESAFDRWDNHLPISSICWVFPDVPQLYAEIIRLMRSSRGELNFNDALIALACRERKISAIASFDADFDSIPWLRRLASPDDLL